MSERDPELARLLLLELGRHLPALENDPPDLDESRRAVHALKGSAGLAGQHELAAELLAVERRIQGGEVSAVRDAAHVVRRAQERLLLGETEERSSWPEPPPSLQSRPIDASLWPSYVAELKDRLTGIDEALSGTLAPIEALAVAFRHVHTIKGAASAVGDERVAWFCHGLEERLKPGSGGRQAALTGLEELARWRGVLGGLLDDPESTMRALRASGRPRSAAPAAHPTRPPEEEPRSVAGEDATIRIAASSVDRVLERVTAVAVAREAIVQAAQASLERAPLLRALRANLAEALRLIGPPRPWGAPALAIARVERVAAQLASLGEELEAQSDGVRRRDHGLRESLAEAKRELSAMRQTPLRQLFARLTIAIESEARRSGREVVVRTEGEGETVDRRLAEQLAEPCLQLARNAVAHGIQGPEARLAMGKPRAGTITLSAKKSAGRLGITITDDGAGVDVAAVRQRALDAGAVTPALAEYADDDTLLALLFLPGFSTRETSDLLAGRGIGLDITLAAVQRMAGVIRLSSKKGRGFTARVEVPVESGLAKMVWVVVGGDEYALFASQVAAVRRTEGYLYELTPSLATCLDGLAHAQPPLCLELDVESEHGVARVGVDRVGEVEELLVRPLAPLVAALGPFAGAILRGDGSLRLVLDVYALAPRARALGRAAEGRPSDRPRA